MEAGDPSVSLDLLVRAFIALGTSSKELAKIISLSRVRSATLAFSGGLFFGPPAATLCWLASLLAEMPRHPPR
jgi:hypothetical protein